MNLLFTGVIELLPNGDHHLVAVVSAVFGLALLVPLLLVAGYQDLRSHEIPGGVCLLLYIGMVIHAVLCCGVLITVPIIVCGCATFSTRELPLFGQADFIFIAHFLTAYAGKWMASHQMLVAGIIWLGCLLVFLMFYKAPETGKTYFQMKKENYKEPVMIPAFPSYSVAALITAIVRFPLIHLYWS